MKILQKGFALLCITIVFFACKNQNDEPEKPDYKSWKSMELTASSYNSVENQTKKGNIGLAAWGDTLKPGVKAIAVSRDLIKMGFEHNTRVKIKGLDGYYKVMDKMNRRWKKKIDIYMGTDVQKARNWGKKKVTVYVEGLEKQEKKD
jgi:3D (Asp-Asp-Asp) domain-containing protein